MPITTLELDGIAVPTESILEFDQDYTDLAGETFVRTADGSGILRTGWTGKLATVITGKGWAGRALANARRGASYTLRCAIPDAVDSLTTTVTIPSARRADSGHVPIGFGLVGDHFVATEISNLAALNAASTDDATLTAVSGASAYRVHYWPQLAVRITVNTCRGASDARYAWRLEAEQL
jgi:hypothetical protein